MEKKSRDSEIKYILWRRKMVDFHSREIKSKILNGNTEKTIL